MDKVAAKLPIPVALHDVRASELSQVARLVDELGRRGVPRLSLLVIPGGARGGSAEPGSEDSGAFQEFGSWLREQQGRGSELWCHGWRHRADPVLPRSEVGQWQCRLTGGEAELAGLAVRELEEMVKRALSAFAALQCGAPEGFCPPTWHAPRELRGCLARNGILRGERRLGLWEGRSTWGSFPLSLPSGGGPARFRRAVELALLGLESDPEQARLARPLEWLPLPFRLALHPSDFATAERASQTWRLVERVVERHEPVGQGEWMISKFAEASRAARGSEERRLPWVS
jgi:hypothetical protein